LKLNEKDPDEEVEVTSDSIAQEMQSFGIKLDATTDNIPKFKLQLSSIDFPNMIVKAMFYVL